MALSATMYVFTIRLADADRAVYATLELRAARHPSESAEYLVTRVLAYCLEYGEGIEFSKGGLSDPDQPALAIRDLTGALQAWIEVGVPDAGRLHRASKAAPRVAVYVHRDAEQFLTRIAGERIHRAEALAIRVVDPELLAAIVSRLERRMDFDLAVSEGTLYLTLGGDTSSGAIDERRLG